VQAVLVGTRSNQIAQAAVKSSNEESVKGVYQRRTGSPYRDNLVGFGAQGDLLFLVTKSTVGAWAFWSLIPGG
jgi:hypothetical protein